MRKAFIFVCVLIILFACSFLLAQQVVIGSPTSAGVNYHPLNRYYDYAVSEMIYRQSEINQAGRITHIAFDKLGGSSSVSIHNVTVYMKHTWSNSFSTTVWSTTGFTLVWSGSFPNSASGYQEIELTTPFVYENAQNLDILIVRDYQPYTVEAPYYRNTTTSPYYRTRCTAQQGSLPTALNGTAQRPNIRLTFTPEIQVPPLPATNPFPADTQLDVPINTTLYWSPADSADGYKVYLSTQNPPLELVSTEPDADYNPPFDFDKNTQYYWQVVPYNEAGDAVNCPVWSFISYEPTPLPPENVSLTVDGIDLILSWDPVTHDTDGFNIAPPYYFVYRNDYPYGVFADFEYLGYTALTTYRLTGIGPDELNMFYYIRARLVLP